MENTNTCIRANINTYQCTIGGCTTPHCITSIHESPKISLATHDRCGTNPFKCVTEQNVPYYTRHHLHFLILHHFFVFYLLLSYFILLSVLTWDSCTLSDWIFFILFYLTSSDFTLLCSLLVSLSVSVRVSTVCGEKIGVELKADGELYVNQRNFNFCQGAK